jgi:hypothetical protein
VKTKTKLRDQKSVGVGAACNDGIFCHLLLPILLVDEVHTITITYLPPRSAQY